MRPIEMKDLVTAILTIVLIFLAAGELGDIHSFAQKEARKSVRGWHVHRFFTQQEIKRL